MHRRNLFSRAWLPGLSLLTACGGAQVGEPVHALASPPLMIAASSPAEKRLPVETRREPVEDDLHGTKVKDPYRWLEDGESPEVLRWTEAQNAHTRSILDGIEGREAIRTRLEELLSIGVVGSPAVRKTAKGDRYFHIRREGPQNQPVLYVRDGMRGQDRPLVNPNELSQDGTTALDWWMPSRDGRLIAYGLSESGDEESTLFVRNVDTGEDLSDEIPRTRFCSIAWLPDGKGFYYTRYPQKGSVPEGEERYYRAVFFHQLGSDPASDPKIFGEGREMTDSPSISLSPDGRWLVVRVHQGWDKSEVHLKDLRAKDGQFVPVATGVHALFDPEARNDAIYLRTNDGAPRYKLFKVDPKKPERSAWKEIIPETSDVISDFSVIGNEIIVTYMRDVASRIVRFSLDGKEKGEIALPTIGSSQGASGRWDGEEIFYDFASFAVAPTIYRLDLKTGKSEVWDKVEAPIDESAYEVSRIRARSKDGTMVPAFVVHKKGLVKNGRTPTVINAYGGFNISLLPTFSRASNLLLEKGGILVVANLRGGGEYGEAWHRAGMLESKQNVFDDAIAVAEEVIRSGYTSPEHLGVMGGSNGGLLVGALVTQRPDLFRAAVSAVPLLDMVRYHRFLIAKLWIPEYGSSEDPEQFRWLHAYSPYHQVKDGTRYPAVLFTTAASDSRVDPLHARKMTAAMQHANGSERPILLRVETKAGHGAGKPVAKLVDELTDVYGFLMSEL